MRDCHNIRTAVGLKHHASVTQNIKVSVFHSITHHTVSADSDGMYMDACEQSSVFCFKGKCPNGGCI